MPTLNTATANEQADNFGTSFGTGTLVIYSGTPPANANASLSSNTVLATHTLAGFGSATGGVITASAINDETIAASGTATFARLLGSGGQIVQLSLGTSGAELIVSSTSYVLGGVSSINSLTITQPTA